MKVREISRDKIVFNPLQPRQTFDREKLKDLANSISEAQLLQPIVVRPKGKKFEVVAGERRVKAHDILKRKKVWAVIWQAKDDVDALEKSLVENLQREDLTSVERENAVSELWESGRYKTRSELAKKLGQSNQNISELLRVKEARGKLRVPYKVSTMSISDTDGLTDTQRKQVLKKVEKGEIAPSKVREEVQKIKEEQAFEVDVFDQKEPLEPDSTTKAIGLQSEFDRTYSQWGNILSLLRNYKTLKECGFNKAEVNSFANSIKKIQVIETKTLKDLERFK